MLPISSSTSPKKSARSTILLIAGLGSLLVLGSLSFCYLSQSNGVSSSARSLSESNNVENEQVGNLGATQTNNQDEMLNDDGVEERRRNKKNKPYNGFDQNINWNNGADWNQNIGNTNDGTSNSGSTTVGTTTTGSSNTGSSTSGSTTNGNTNSGSSSGSVLTYTPNAKCTNGKTAYITGLTDEQKAEVLKAHNALRSQIAMGLQTGQPGATDMLEMVWDDEVAARAQAWADNCVFDHDGDNDRSTSQFSYVGQNLDIIMDSTKLKSIDLSSMVQDWYSEVQYYGGAAPVSNYQWNQNTGHYTQLVWAKSYALGCGFKAYQDGGMYSYQLTCNYGPGGNTIGEKMYSKGTFSADKCVNGASSTYAGLCKK